MIRKIDVGALRCLGDDYGIKIVGFRNVLFVAPHCAEDHEGAVNDLIARICAVTGSSAVINTQIPRRLIDLNNFEEINQVKRGATADFLNDLQLQGMQLLRYYGRVTIVFVHFSPRKYYRMKSLYERNASGKLVKVRAGDLRDFDVDIGCGLTESGNELISAKVVNPKRGNGIITCDPTFAESVKMNFERYDLNVRVGREWAALRSCNMVQAMKKRFYSENIFQLEIVEDVGVSDAVFEAMVGMCLKG